MTLIPIILYFGGFILIMFGFALSVRAQKQHIRLIRQDDPYQRCCNTHDRPLSPLC